MAATKKQEKLPQSSLFEEHNYILMQSFQMQSFSLDWETAQDI